MPNVCDNNVYEAQMYISFYYFNDNTDWCTGQWHCGCTPKDELYTTPKTNAQVIWSICNSLMQMSSLYTLTSYIWSKRVFSKWYTFLCYRASQSSVSTRWSPLTTCIKHSNFHIYKFHVLLISYTRLFMKLNPFKILFYVTFITTKVSRSMAVQ